MHARHALRMRFDAFLTLAQPAPKLAPHRCSRACRAVKREAGRVLRQEIANLRCPRNGKRPRRMTQAGSGAFRVQVRTRARATARTRGKASRSVASPDTGRCGKPAGLHDAWPAGKRGAQCSTRFHFDADPNRARSASSAPPRAARRGPRADCCGCRFVRSGADTGGRSARIDCAAHRRVSGRASHACSSIERQRTAQARRRSTRYGGFHYIAQIAGRATLRCDANTTVGRVARRHRRVTVPGARINNPFNEDDELAYAHYTRSRDAHVRPGRRRA